MVMRAVVVARRDWRVSAERSTGPPSPRRLRAGVLTIALPWVLCRHLPKGWPSLPLSNQHGLGDTRCLNSGRATLQNKKKRLTAITELGGQEKRNKGRGEKRNTSN